MATATTPAAPMPKRPPFNRETKSLIDSLGGGVESMTPRSSRTARNSNPGSPLLSPASSSRFPLPSRRRLRKETDDRPSPGSACSEPPISGSSSSLIDYPSAPSPLTTNLLADVAPAASLPTQQEPLLQPSVSQPKRKRNGTKSSSTRRPGSDSSLSDLSDSGLARRPAKKPSRPHLRPIPDVSISAPLTPSIAVTQSTPPKVFAALPPPQIQLDLDKPTPKPQRLILKPPMPQRPSPENSLLAKVALVAPIPIPKLKVASKPEVNKNNPKGKGKALQVPLLKGARRAAKNSTLRSRSTSNTPRARRLTDLQKQELEQKRAKLLASLDEEEAMIKSSTHPLLVELQTNIERGRTIKLRQAHLRHEALKTFLARQHEEREERIWSTWADDKVRLRSELLLKCQLQLAHAPFEFVMSNDTSNLQAMFHLTSLPKPAPFVRDLAHTISADSLVMGLERQRIKNHDTWTLSSSAIEADLALLRGTAKTNTTRSDMNQSHSQTHFSPVASSSSTSVSTAATQSKRKVKKSVDRSVSSSSYVPAAGQAQIYCQQNMAESTSNALSQSPWSSSVPAAASRMSESGPQIPEGSRPRRRVKSSQHSEQTGSPGPRRRSTRVKQLNSPSSSMPNELHPDQGTCEPQASRADPGPLDDIRSAIHSWAFPEAARLSPAILAHSSTSAAPHDPHLEYHPPRLDCASAAGLAIDHAPYRTGTVQPAEFLHSPRPAHVPPSSNYETYNPSPNDTPISSSHPAPPQTQDQWRYHDSNCLSGSDSPVTHAPSHLYSASAGEEPLNSTAYPSFDQYRSQHLASFDASSSKRRTETPTSHNQSIEKRDWGTNRIEPPGGGRGNGPVKKRGGVGGMLMDYQPRTSSSLKVMNLVE